MLSQQELIFDALGSSVRRDIIQMLSDKPMSVGDIASQLPVTRPAISKHLKLLKEANLVASQAVGTRNVFSLESAGFDNARSWLDGLWDDALMRLKILAENTTAEA